MRNNEEIVELITKLKDEKNLSISELARNVGMAKSAVSRYLNKTREFPLNKADDFSKALGVTPEFLLGVEPETKNEIIDLSEEDAVFAFDGKPVSKEEREMLAAVIAAHRANKK